MKVFISYSSKDRLLVEALAEDLESQGHNVWFDQQTPGGHEWWNTILNALEDSDLFIFALSANSLDSYPCKLEYEWASSINKRVLPVQIASIQTSFLPPQLSVIQYVDYRIRDNAAANRLSRSINLLPPKRDLPDKMPSRPDPPISPIGKLKERIDKPSLTSDEQAGLVFELKQFMENSNERHDAVELLHRMRNRSDLLANIAYEIENVLTQNQAGERILQKTVTLKNNALTQETIVSDIPHTTLNFRVMGWYMLRYVIAFIAVLFVILMPLKLNFLSGNLSENLKLVVTALGMGFMMIVLYQIKASTTSIESRWLLNIIVIVIAAVIPMGTFFPSISGIIFLSGVWSISKTVIAAILLTLTERLAFSFYRYGLLIRSVGFMLFSYLAISNAAIGSNIVEVDNIGFWIVATGVVSAFALQQATLPFSKNLTSSR